MAFIGDHEREFRGDDGVLPAKWFKCGLFR